MFSFAGQRVSVKATPLCHCSAQAALGDVWVGVAVCQYSFMCENGQQAILATPGLDDCHNPCKRWCWLGCLGW